MHVQAKSTHFVSLRWNSRESGGTHDKDGFVLSAHPGRSQGRPRTTSSSQLISQIGLPDRVSQQCPVSREHDAHGGGGREFHPRTTATLTAPRCMRSLAVPCASGICARALTGRRPTGRPRGLSARCSLAGPTQRSTATAASVRVRLTAGCGPTTITADIRLSATSRQSLDYSSEPGPTLSVLTPSLGVFQGALTRRSTSSAMPSIGRRSWARESRSRRVIVRSSRLW